MNKQAFLLGFGIGITFGVITLMLIPFFFRVFCNPEVIVQRRDAVNKHYYQLSNGNGFWSETELKEGKLFCTFKKQIIQPIP